MGPEAGPLSYSISCEGWEDLLQLKQVRGMQKSGPVNGADIYEHVRGKAGQT
jgi:hypothetical protein